MHHSDRLKSTAPKEREMRAVKRTRRHYSQAIKARQKKVRTGIVYKIPRLCVLENNTFFLEMLWCGWVSSYPYKATINSETSKLG